IRCCPPGWLLLPRFWLGLALGAGPRRIRRRRLRRPPGPEGPPEGWFGPIFMLWSSSSFSLCAPLARSFDPLSLRAGSWTLHPPNRERFDLRSGLRAEGPRLLPKIHAPG